MLLVIASRGLTSRSKLPGLPKHGSMPKPGQHAGAVQQTKHPFVSFPDGSTLSIAMEFSCLLYIAFRPRSCDCAENVMTSCSIFANCNQFSQIYLL